VNKKDKKSEKLYNPNLGFIGNSEVKVSNYLFSGKRIRSAYVHARPVAKRILNTEVNSHYNESKKLTKFLKNRDLTFSKKTAKGEQKTFTVPCTTTVIPLQKSLFNEIEKASQTLMISLRRVLQDIYGAKDLRSSKFIQSLPTETRDIFINAIDGTADYFPQLHHPNMKDYPFLDNVGLDLVLVEDFIQQSKNFPELINSKNIEKIPSLPFRILEINAGSPSGASNNMNMLEGIYNQNPEILDSLGKMMPNDHFKILGETYKSLGESWTGIEDGVQIVLPPGGQNGAAPEIHQLAAFSGLIYADADQLYQDDEGYIRLRTVGKHNPIVTAVYSRINSDSALFDPKKNIILRDPESGEAIYYSDNLKLDKDGKATIIKDVKGNPIPLQSSYSIPGLLEAIINKKIYMGGLNRIVDNKIILATLTHFAPIYFEQDIIKKGVNPNGPAILPPATLPPTKKSADIICANPDEWVVKAPSLAGGQGVYILKTLPKAQKNKVLAMIQKDPDIFAYQQLVKLGRIPVAVQRKDVGFRFANLAADIRMWVFFGGGEDALPKVSHNALVRYAPQERGSMSSIVNTSAGGGYAPFVIMDDTNDKNAVTAKELVTPPSIKKINIELPIFVGAQMVQISRMLKQASDLLCKEATSAYEVLGLAYSMKSQLKEILSFLHPRTIEHIYKVIDLLEVKISKQHIADYFKKINKNQLELVSLLQKHEGKKLPKDFRDMIDNIRVVNIDILNTFYTEEDRALDFVLISDLKKLIKEKVNDKEVKNDLNKFTRLLMQSAQDEFPYGLLKLRTKNLIARHLQNFCDQAKERLNSSSTTAEFSELFSLTPYVSTFQFETLYLGKKDSDREIEIASQYEMRMGVRLVDTKYVKDELKVARINWLSVLDSANRLNGSKRAAYLAEQKLAHFAKHPVLSQYQSLLNKQNCSKSELIQLLDIAPYAKFNIEHFAKQQGVSLERIFSSSLKPNRISILSEKQLESKKIASRDFSGECFAKKKKSHGLYSDSDIFVWLRDSIDPFTMIYTAGHELIHYQQIKHSMQAEKRAIQDGGLSAAKFLNYYGNFLGANQRTIDSINFSMQSERKPLYGFTDRLVKDFSSPIIKELRDSIHKGDEAWSKKLNKYGSLFGYMMPNAVDSKVKALQEVLPALENAKNIIFAQELGLDIPYDAVKASMPSANNTQIKSYRKLITEAATSSAINWEALRIIANHQYHGISFYRADRDEDNLVLAPRVNAVTVGNSYNQTQQ